MQGLTGDQGKAGRNGSKGDKVCIINYILQAV